MIKIEDLYLVGVSTHVFRQGSPALITGIKNVTPEYVDAAPRVCYEIKFPDQVVDQIPCSEVEAGHYALVTFDNIMAAFGEQINALKQKIEDNKKNFNQPPAPELAKVININANIAAPRA